MSMVLGFGFLAISVYAQTLPQLAQRAPLTSELPAQGRYVANDLNAEFRYITVFPGRDANSRVITLEDSNNNIVHRVAIRANRTQNGFTGQIARRGGITIDNLHRNSFRFQLGEGAHITYTKT